jgi:DNA-binding NarL/FixJ family response regulator
MTGNRPSEAPPEPAAGRAVLPRVFGVLLVDDHPLIRQGMKSILESNPRYKVVGEAGNGEEALRAVRGLAPDLVMVDICLPDVNGIQLVRDMLAAEPTVRPIIVSLHADLELAAAALEAGALGYVTKCSSPGDLCAALDAALDDKLFLDKRIFESFRGDAPGLLPEDLRRLTRRERQIMGLVAGGLKNREIAAKLKISRKTVENHRARIMDKLELRNLVELIGCAARLGLVEIVGWK